MIEETRYERIPLVFSHEFKQERSWQKHARQELLEKTKQEHRDDSADSIDLILCVGKYLSSLHGNGWKWLGTIHFMRIHHAEVIPEKSIRYSSKISTCVNLVVIYSMRLYATAAFFQTVSGSHLNPVIVTFHETMCFLGIFPWELQGFIYKPIQHIPSKHNYQDMAFHSDIWPNSSSAIFILPYVVYISRWGLGTTTWCSYPRFIICW